jgi:hypothetical protein
MAKKNGASSSLITESGKHTRDSSAYVAGLGPRAGLKRVHMKGPEYKQYVNLTRLVA